jgi:hypothetical protein
MEVRKIVFLTIIAIILNHSKNKKGSFLPFSRVVWDEAYLIKIGLKPILTKSLWIHYFINRLKF